MKGTYPRFVYILMTVLGAAVLVINAWLDLTVAVCAIGAGLFAYGVNRLIGEWRITHDPEHDTDHHCHFPGGPWDRAAVCGNEILWITLSLYYVRDLRAVFYYL